MAATTAGALKAYIETLGLGLAAYRDAAPNDAAKKYVRISEAITITPQRHGDTGSPTAAVAVAEEVQVDLFEALYDDSGDVIAESYTVKDDLVRKLHGARLPAGPKHVYGVTVLNASRFPPGPDDDANVIRTLIRLSIKRAL